MAYNNLIGKTGYVYILANYNRNVLYVGVTTDLVYRVGKHKKGEGAKFTAKYNVKYLMHVEEYSDIDRAIQREKQLKNWRHQWKINLIKQSNPVMKDLWDDIRK